MLTFGNAYAEAPELAAVEKGLEKTSVAIDDTTGSNDDLTFIVAEDTIVKPAVRVATLFFPQQKSHIASNVEAKPSIRAPPHSSL